MVGLQEMLRLWKTGQAPLTFGRKSWSIPCQQCHAEPFVQLDCILLVESWQGILHEHLRKPVESALSLSCLASVQSFSKSILRLDLDLAHRQDPN